MNKQVSWKGSLLIALIAYSLKFILGAYLPTIAVALLEITGLVTLVFGIIGGLKVALLKRKKTSRKNKAKV